jgi:hypothetical protein
MSANAKVISAVIAAILVSAIMAGSSLVAKSYAENPIQNFIGNVTKTGKSLIANVTNLGNNTASNNQTSTTGNQTGKPLEGLQFHNGMLTGRIASIQQDVNGPAWILAGIWKLEEVKGGAEQQQQANATGMTTSNATMTTKGNTTVTAPGNATISTHGNQTTITTKGNTTVTAPGNATIAAQGNATTIKANNTSSTTSGQSNATGSQQFKFTAKIEMVRPNGTGFHEHEVSDLKVIQFKKDQFGNPTINGTATVTMKDGPVKDVPVTIKIINNATFAMTIGPDKVNNHFGTAPIFGTVEQPQKKR